MLLSSKPLIRFARQVVISTCDNYFILLQTMSPHVWKNGFWNQGNFCLWTPESGIFLHVESGILSFGIRNTLQRIRIPTNDWNSESKFHWQRLESSTWNPESRIQDCLWILLHEVITRPGYHLKVLLKFTCTIVSPKTRQNLAKHLATFRFELLSQ